MAHVSHKLTGPFQGALAGGGDPATLPLYVFGPFLKLVVTAGVAGVTFGASIWLAVLTVVTVSAMYRLVMTWVTDGSGGSGLNEEEFGPWAVKVNAGITVIEYTLTFLVSVAALVTFAADRIPHLNGHFAGMPLRTLLAAALSLGAAVAVNRGPRVAARIFGPATAGVMLLLWLMIGATIWQHGLRLPNFTLQAFSGRYLGLTLGGYAHILALMTGVEIFANLVAAYEGTARERGRKAFGSLLIVMGTTSLTMLVVGPAILDLSDPFDPHVSVFTQTMDRLLPAPLAYGGTLVGILVLLSAAAASAQGIQNLALGLRYRHYIPAYLGQRNRFEVAHRPVWLQAGACIGCFVLFGTAEETYLALYAAGVFVLLSLTGWAAVKRLLRVLRVQATLGRALTLMGTLLAATLTTGATAIIFEDRFREGAWAYFLLVPALFVAFGFFRRRLGAPSPVEDRLGRLMASSYLPPLTSQSLYRPEAAHHVLCPLDRSPDAEHALGVARTLARACGSRLTLLSVLEPGAHETAREEVLAVEYLEAVRDELCAEGHTADFVLGRGSAPEEIGRAARSLGVDAVIMTTRGRTRLQRWWSQSVTSEVIYQTTPPLIVVRPTEHFRSTRTRFARLLVALDGSELAEQVLPHARELASQFTSEVVLLSVREGSESEEYTDTIHRYLDGIRERFEASGVSARALVESSAPAQTILRVAATEEADLLMLVSHGRGGLARQEYVRLGSVADAILETTPCPVFLVSAVPPGESGIPSVTSAAAQS